MDLPLELRPKLHEHALEPVGLGESGASVWRCTLADTPALYLKTASIASDLGLEGEAVRLRWMKSRELPVPTVVQYLRSDGIAYLLLDEIPGKPASDASWHAVLPEVMSALGSGLALIHRTSIADCPFDHRVQRQIEEARVRFADGRVREDDFDDERIGRRAADLFDELVSSVPVDEDLVYTHGDFSLPNIMLQRSAEGRLTLAGLIDCGRAGVADRHQDIALAVRSITYNFGSSWVEPFLDAYGLARPQPAKLRFYTLLDDFF